MKDIAFLMALLLANGLPVLGCDDDDNDDNSAGDGDVDMDGDGDGDGDTDAGPTELLTEVLSFAPPNNEWPGAGGGLTWDGVSLWIGWGWYLWEVSTTDGSLLTTYSDNEAGFSGGEQCGGLAFSGALWMVGSRLDQVVHFDGHPPTAGDFEAHGSAAASGSALAWDGLALWGQNGSAIWKYSGNIDVDTGNYVVAATFAQPGSAGEYSIDGLAWDEVSATLWSCGNDKGGRGLVIVRHAMDAALSWDATYPLGDGDIPWACDGLAFAGADLWVLVHNDNGDAQKELRKYRINR